MCVNLALKAHVASSRNPIAAHVDRAAVAMLCCARMTAQDDPKHVPLGDVARNLRNDNPPAKPVIDDHNWSQVGDPPGCQETLR